MPLIDLEIGINDLVLIDSTTSLEEDSIGLVSLVYSVSERKTFEEIFPPYDITEEFVLPAISSDISDFHIDVPIGSLLLGIESGFYTEYPAWEKNYNTLVDIEEFVQADFENGETVVVRGWVLSRTEARQCALFSLTNPNI